MDRKQFDGYWYISCDVLEVGDYSGAGSVGEANIRALEDRKGAYTEYSHYSYERLWLPDTEENRLIIDSLDNYCLYDEEEHSKVELEWEKEAWSDYVRKELLRSLPDEVSEALDCLDRDVQWELYRESMELENQYPSFENNSCYIRTANITGAFLELAQKQLLYETAGITQGIFQFDTDDPFDCLGLSDYLEEHGEQVLSEFIRWHARQLQES